MLGSQTVEYDSQASRLRAMAGRAGTLGPCRYSAEVGVINVKRGK